MIDTEGPDVLSWEEVFRAHGCALPRERWRDGIGSASGAFDPYAELQHQAGRPVDISVVRALRHRRLRELVDAEPLRPGIAEYLQAATEAGVRLGIASNASRGWVEQHLAQRGLRGLFGVVLGVDDADQPKPAPDLYLRAARRLSVRPADAVAVEDSPHGVLAAKRAGMFCVATPHGLTAGLPMDGADVVVESLAVLAFGELRARWAARPRRSGAGHGRVPHR